MIFIAATATTIPIICRQKRPSTDSTSDFGGTVVAGAKELVTS